MRSLSEREWSSVRELRDFNRQQLEKQRLAEDQEQHRRYVESVNKDQERVAPRYKVEALDFDSWRAFIDADQDDPVLRGQAATHRALLNRLSQAEEQDNEAARKLILADRPDPMWRLPESAKGLSMSVSQAKKFAQSQSEQFVRENPDYETYRSAETYAAITNYLLAQPDLQIPNSECFRTAFVRLRDLGLIKPATVPPPEAAPIEPEPELEPTEAPSSDLVDGWDIQSGEPRQYSQADIWKMSSTDLKKAFRMFAGRDEDRRPRFTRSRYQ